MERLELDFLFHWFVGLGVDEAVWDHFSVDGTLIDGLSLDEVVPA